MNETNTQEIINETDLDGIIQELTEECASECCRVSYEKPKKPSLFKRFSYMVRRVVVRPKPQSKLRDRFRRLAGIDNTCIVATLILPDGNRITYNELPPWHLALRYKFCGFQYYEKE